MWRFPFTAYENGGGAFLLPYLVVLLLIGRPLYLLELGLGQFSGGGCVSVWRLAPGLAGVGYGQVLSSACVVSYYCSLIGECYTQLNDLNKINTTLFRPLILLPGGLVSVHASLDNLSS